MYFNLEYTYNTSNNVSWTTFLVILSYSKHQCYIIISDIFMFKAIWLYSKLEYTQVYKNKVTGTTFVQVFWLAIKCYASFPYLTLKYGCTPHWSTLIKQKYGHMNYILFILDHSIKQYCDIISNIFIFKIKWLYSKLEYTQLYKNKFTVTTFVHSSKFSD